MSFAKYKISNLNIDADGSLGTSGAYGVTFTVTGETGVTLPTSGTLATTDNPVFTTAITAPVIKPAADSTTAVKVQNAAGTTDVITIDTTNGRVGVGGAPVSALQATETSAGAMTFPITLNNSSTDANTGTAFAFSPSTNAGAYKGAIGYARTTTFARGKLYFMVDSAADEFNVELSDTKMVITHTGNVGVGEPDPTGVIHLKAGTAAAGTAPLKLTTGVNLTTPEAGAIEYDGDYIYYTNSAATRKKLATTTSPTFTTSVTLNYATASEIAGTDASKNLVSLPVATYPSLTELAYVKGVTSAIQTQIDAKQAISSTRYVKGDISGAVAIDYDDGDFQECTTTDTVTGITISNLPTNGGMVLQINNTAEKSVTFGTTEIIAVTDTATYLCAFMNINGTNYFTGKSQRYS